MAILSGCSDNNPRPKGKPPMRFPAAVVTARSGLDTASAPVAENYAVSPAGQPTSYSGGLSLQQGAICVCYTYVGRAEYALPKSDPQQWSEADIYVFTISTSDGNVVNRPVMYIGEKLMMPFEDWDLTVEIRPHKGRE
jgi:hypothetical protein